MGPDWWRTSAIVVALITAGGIGYATLQTMQKINQLTQERDNLQAEVELLRPYIEEYQRLEARQRELEQIAAVAREVRAKFHPWSDYLAKFLAHFPQKQGRLLVRLDSLSAQLTDPYLAMETYGIPAEVEFSFTGKAASEEALIELVKAYETTPGFAINFQDATYNKEEGTYSFSASVGMEIERPEEAEAGAEEGGGEEIQGEVAQ